MLPEAPRSAIPRRGSARGVEDEPATGTFHRHHDVDELHESSPPLAARISCADAIGATCGEMPLIDRAVTSHLPVEPVNTLMKATVCVAKCRMTYSHPKRKKTTRETMAHGRRHSCLSAWLRPSKATNA